MNLATALEREHFGVRRAFMATWDSQWIERDSRAPFATQLRFQTYVIPISISVPGANTATQYPAARKGNSAFAQYTEIDAAERTEWVRYDWYESSRAQLVRDDPAALGAVQTAIAGVPPGGWQPPAPGGGGGSGHDGLAAPPAPPAGPAEPRPQTATSSSVWDPHIGKSENENFPMSEAIDPREPGAKDEGAK